MKTKMNALSIIILIVLAADIFLPFLLAIPYNGYSHTKTVMSVLGARESPLRLVYNAWTIISGCIFILFGYILFNHYGEEYKGLCVALWVLFILYGLGCEIISGIFPVNENADDKTVSSIIHGVGSVIGFTALLFCPLLLGIIQIKSKETIVGIVSIICFILSFAAYVLFVMGDKSEFQNTAISLSGLWQRVSMYFMYIPLCVFILKRLIEKSV